MHILKTLKTFIIPGLLAFVFLYVLAVPNYSQKASSKVNNLLKQIEKAKSLTDIRNATKGVEFTQSEMDQLKRILSQPAYSSKLQNFINREKMKSKAKVDPNKIPAQVLRKQQAMDRRYNQTISQLNRQAISKLRSLKNMKPAKIKYSFQNISTRGMSAKARLPGGGTPGRINSVSPDPAVIGRSLTVTGENFGSEGGLVALIVGREMDYFSVTSWNDSRIIVSTTEALTALVGESERRATLWVKLGDGELGPTQDIRIRPDSSSLVPEITEITDPIGTGYACIIAGRNFLTESRGTVRLRMRNRYTRREDTFDMEITDWADNYIAGNFGDIDGFSRCTGTIIVRNHAGQEATITTNFEPEMVTLTWAGPIETIHCEYWTGEGPMGGGPSEPVTGGPSILCLFGKYRKISNDLRQIIDDWVVSDFYIEEIEEYGWTGNNILKNPTFNTTMVTISYEFEVWAELFSLLRVKPWLVLQGPKNVSCGLRGINTHR